MPRSVLWARTPGIALAASTGLALGACSLITATDDLTAGASLEADAGASHPKGADASHADAGEPGIDASNGEPSDAASTDAASDSASATDSASASDTATAADTGVVCTGGKIACNGVCVDPASDPNHCNGCGNTCASGVCGSSVVEAMAAQPAAWTFNGTASWNSFAPSGMLTAAAVTHQAGTIVYNHAIIVDAFSVAFQFRIGLQGGTRSDGMGFMLEKNGVTAVGSDGMGLGMAGLQGFGVELDIYNNAMCSDANDDHIGLDSLTRCSTNGPPTSLAAVDVSATLDLGDTHWHSETISLASGAVTVTIDGHVFMNALPVTGLTSGDAYYFGFAGATGGIVDSSGTGGYRQEVKNVAITFPTPRCL